MKRQAQERRQRQEIKVKHAERKAQRMLLKAVKMEAEVWKKPEHFFFTGNAIVFPTSVQKDSLVFTERAQFSGNNSLSSKQATSTDICNMYQAFQSKQVYVQSPHYSNLTTTPSLPPDLPAVQPPTSVFVSFSAPNNVTYLSLVQAHTVPIVSSASELYTFSVFWGSIPCSSTATRALNYNSPAFLHSWSLPAATISNPQQQKCQHQNLLVSSQNSMQNTGLVSNFLHRASVSSYLPVTGPPSTSHLPPSVSTYPQHSICYNHHFLPQPKIPKFNGDSLQYRNLKMNFKTHIESKFKDPKILLCLQLQHFEPKLRNRFQHFTDKAMLAIKWH